MTPIDGEAARPVQVGAVLAGALRMVRDRWEEGEAFPGIATGLTDLDHLLGGLQIGALTIVTGDRGPVLDAFETTLVLNAARSGAWVVVVDRDVDPQVVALRYVAGAARVPWESVWRGRLTRDQWARLESASDQLSDAPIWIHAPSGPSLAALIEALAATVGESGAPGLVVVRGLAQMISEARDLGDRDALGALLAASTARLSALVGIEAVLDGAKCIDHRSYGAVVVCKESPTGLGGVGTVVMRVEANQFGGTGAVTVAHLLRETLLADLVDPGDED